MNAGQPYLAALYTTLFSTAHFGLFRVSELTSEHAVLAKDVFIGENKDKFMLILRSSKTHTKGMEPQIIKISSTNRQRKGHKAAALPCPYNTLWKFSKIRGNYSSDDDHFFTFSDGSPVQARHMRMVLKLMVKNAGFNEKFYSTHSLRSGRSSDLYKLGISIEKIKKLGRWRSNAVYRYLKYT